VPVVQKEISKVSKVFALGIKAAKDNNGWCLFTHIHVNLTQNVKSAWIICNNPFLSYHPCSVKTVTFVCMIHIKSFVCNPYQENTYLLYDDDGTTAIIDPGMYGAAEEEAVRAF